MRAARAFSLGLVVVVWGCAAAGSQAPATGPGSASAQPPPFFPAKVPRDPNAPPRPPLSETFPRPTGALTVDEAMAVLTNQKGLTFGTNCGYGGQVMPSLDAIATLFFAGRRDLIVQVLSSPQPAGRAIAANLLLRMEPTAKEREKIESVAAENIEVRACSGCIYGSTPIRNAVETDEVADVQLISDWYQVQAVADDQK